VLFLSWFGPIGVAAIFYASFMERFAVPHSEAVFGAASLAVCASVVVHSLTATPGVLSYPRRPPLATLRHPLHRDVGRTAVTWPQQRGKASLYWAFLACQSKASERVDP